jgi:hypothetical protein
MHSPLQYITETNGPTHSSTPAHGQQKLPAHVFKFQHPNATTKFNERREDKEEESEGTRNKKIKQSKKIYIT